MSSELLSVGGVLGGVLALGQFGYGIWKDRKGGTLRKSQAEAAKASLDTAQAEAALPHIQDQLRLGNVAEAVAIQQGIINGLREHAAWQDGQLDEAHRREKALEDRLSERDAKIAELEQRLGEAEKALTIAKRLIGDLRADARREHDDDEGAPE